MRSSGTRPLTVVSRAKKAHSQQTAKVLESSSAAHMTSGIDSRNEAGSSRGQARKAAVCVSSSGHSFNAPGTRAVGMARSGRCEGTKGGSGGACDTSDPERLRRARGVSRDMVLWTYKRKRKAACLHAAARGDLCRDFAMPPKSVFGSLVSPQEQLLHSHC